MKLSGKTAVVTGASRGIGRSLAVALAREGCSLVLTALEPDELDAVAVDLGRECGFPIATRAADLTDPADCQAFAEWLQGLKAPCDIFINNAGGGWFGSFTACSWESLQRTLLLNVYAPTFLAHAVLPMLRDRPEAMIVNISSAVATLPYPGLAVYGAAKAFISSLSASLQCELGEGSVRLLCFHPGFTATPFISSAGMDLAKVSPRLISSPEALARHIVRSMKRNRSWAYSDAAGRFGAALAAALPHRLRIRLFRNLFWEVPGP